MTFPAASCEAEDQDPARHRSTPTLRCRPPPGTAAGLRTRDSQIATLWHDINNERLTRARTSAQRLAAKTTLRTSVPDAAHTLWALTAPELYILQVTELGRRPDTYQRWLADLLTAALLAH